MRRSLLAALVFLACVGPALAEVRIVASPGGEATSFLDYFEALRRSGERVVIDGPCFSACTLVFDVVPKHRICVTRRAVLGFHAAKLVDRRTGEEFAAPKETRAVARAYPAPIRAWIRRHGGLTRRPLFLYGRELAAMYRACR
jgi:hypothetical protein